MPYAIIKGNQYFDATLWTGDDTSLRTISGLSFQPDFIWTKRRTSGSTANNDHWLYDSVRGVGSNSLLTLTSNSTGAEFDGRGLGGNATAITSTGFTVTAGSSTNTNLNQSGNAFVAWQWKAGGTAVSNTAGSITSQVSANTTSGFSVVTYTGTGANATVGHGLGVKPTMIIVKERSGTQGWTVYYLTPNGLGGADRYLSLNSTAAYTLDSTVFQSVDPTSSVFSIGTSTLTNASSQTYVAYCFASVKGYSQIAGSFVGNGSAEGPFIYLGFRPAYILIKNVSNAGDWTVLDNKRNTYNSEDKVLLAQSSAAETTEANQGDFLSNGFKIRSDGAGSRNNNNGQTYIYMAFAEMPTKYANAR